MRKPTDSSDMGPRESNEVPNGNPFETKKSLAVYKPGNIGEESGAGGPVDKAIDQPYSDNFPNYK